MFGPLTNPYAARIYADKDKLKTGFFNGPDRTRTGDLLRDRQAC